jgi:hypothetical protein
MVRSDAPKSDLSDFGNLKYKSAKAGLYASRLEP